MEIRSWNRTRNSFLLFITACIWGMAFISQIKGMDYMHPLTFNGTRSFIGAFSLLVFLLIQRALYGKNKSKIDWKSNFKAGVWCGLIFTFASTLQQFGVMYTTAGKAGFITALYIIFVPIAGVFLGRKISEITWISAVMAACGMYFLCVSEKLSLGKGDFLVFLCAIGFAVHIMVIDHYVDRTDGAIVSCIQFFICGILCGIADLIWGNPSVQQMIDGMGTLLYAGVLSCGVGYTLQMVGQKGMNPTMVALILSLESVVAAVSSWIAYRIGFLKTDQTMTTQQVIGCVIIFCAVILVQLPEEWFRIRSYRNKFGEEV